MKCGGSGDLIRRVILDLESFLYVDLRESNMLEAIIVDSVYKMWMYNKKKAEVVTINSLRTQKLSKRTTPHNNQRFGFKSE
jgi:hypothetical protein